MAGSVTAPAVVHSAWAVVFAPALSDTVAVKLKFKPVLCDCKSVPFGSVTADAAESVTVMTAFDAGFLAMP